MLWDISQHPWQTASPPPPGQQAAAQVKEGQDRVQFMQPSGRGDNICRQLGGTSGGRSRESTGVTNQDPQNSWGDGAGSNQADGKTPERR